MQAPRSVEKVMESKTLRFWLIIFVIGLTTVFGAALLQHYLGVQVPLVSDFLNLLGIGGGGATVRNVAADHIVPAWQQRQQTSYPSSPFAPRPGPPP